MHTPFWEISGANRNFDALRKINRDTSMPPGPPTPTYLLVLRWVDLPLLAIGILSNALVIVAVLRDTRMRHSPMYLILANLVGTFLNFRKIEHLSGNLPSYC